MSSQFQSQSQKTFQPWKWGEQSSSSISLAETVQDKSSEERPMPKTSVKGYKNRSRYSQNSQSHSQVPQGYSQNSQGYPQSYQMSMPPPATSQNSVLVDKILFDSYMYQCALNYYSLSAQQQNVLFIPGVTPLKFVDSTGGAYNQGESQEFIEM